MSKRILFGGVLAIALAFGMAGTAQAQFPGHHHHHHYHGGYRPAVSFYSGVYAPPLFSPVVVPSVVTPIAPPVLPSLVPFPGYGTAVYAPPAPIIYSSPYPGYGVSGGIGLTTPNLSIGIGIRR